MTYPVYEGGDEDVLEALEERERLLHAGLVELNVPLNGGSETRRAIREFYEELYAQFSWMEVVSSGCSLTVRRKRYRPSLSSAERAPAFEAGGRRSESSREDQQ